MTKREWLLKEGWQPTFVRKWDITMFQDLTTFQKHTVLNDVTTIETGKFYKYFLVMGDYYKITMYLNGEVPQYDHQAWRDFCRKNSRYRYFDCDKLLDKQVKKVSRILDKIGREEWIKLMRGADGIPETLEKEEK